MNYSLVYTTLVRMTISIESKLHTNYLKFTSNNENPCELSNCQVVSDCKIVTATTDMSNKGAGNF